MVVSVDLGLGKVGFPTTVEMCLNLFSLALIEYNILGNIAYKQAKHNIHQHQCGGSQQSETTVSGNTTLSSGQPGHQAHMRCTDVHATKTSIILK